MPKKKRKKAKPKRRKAKPKKKAKAKKKRCAAKTKAGKRCKRYASGRSKYCSVHK
jgi:hypothetical protein